MQDGPGRHFFGRFNQRTFTRPRQRTHAAFAHDPVWGQRLICRKSKVPRLCLVEVNDGPVIKNTALWGTTTKFPGRFRAVRPLQTICRVQGKRSAVSTAFFSLEDFHPEGPDCAASDEQISCVSVIEVQSAPGCTTVL